MINKNDNHELHLINDFLSKDIDKYVIYKIYNINRISKNLREILDKHVQGNVTMNITESRRYVIVVHLSSWLRFDGKMRNQRMNYCCANSAENLILILIRIWSNLYFCRLKWIIICLDQHSSSMFNQTLQYHFSLTSFTCVSNYYLITVQYLSYSLRDKLTITDTTQL